MGKGGSHHPDQASGREGNGQPCPCLLKPLAWPLGSSTGSGGSEKRSPLGRSLDPGTMPARANHPQPKLCHLSSDSLCSPVVHCGSIQRLRGCSGAERSQEVRPANAVGTAPAATVRAGIFSVRRGWGVAVTVFRQLGLNPSPAPRPAPLEFSALGQSGAPSKPAAPFLTR